MTTPMTTQQLIESTMLDALGLLDTEEQAAFEAAFASAPEQVKAHVRAEQARMADLDVVLPATEPPVVLRRRVIEAVRREIIASGATPAPAATPTRTTTHTPAMRDAAPRRRNRVSPMWRASTVGLAAAVVALAGVVFQLRVSYESLTRETAVAAFYESIGLSYLDSTLFDPNTHRVAMTPVSTDGPQASAVAAVWHNPDWGTARLFHRNLRASDGEMFRVVVLDSAGNEVREVDRFWSNGTLRDLDVDIDLRTETRIAIFSITDPSDQTGTLLLDSQIGPTASL